MPVMSTNLDVNVHVSAPAHFLKRTGAMALLGERYNFNAPRLRFSGITTGKSVDQDNKALFEVVLDELPDDTLTLDGTSLTVMERNDADDGGDDNNLEHADASEEEEEVVVESDQSSFYQKLP
ncbi:hypothetical protein [Parasitella parasitica]|uniref:Uncharacterized protein n=1 Tax=Parasitella parasitica TaxID=35722 RepID=A0A0B7NIS8_9FUNG|nr:hypothetical protein [Parasitella parasitica]